MTKVLYETVDPVVAGSNLVVLALDFLEISVRKRAVSQFDRQRCTADENFWQTINSIVMSASLIPFYSAVSNF